MNRERTQCAADALDEHVDVRTRVLVGDDGQVELASVGEHADADRDIPDQGHDWEQLKQRSTGQMEPRRWSRRGIHLEAMRQLARRFAQGPPPSGPGGTRIRQLVREHLASIHENPAAYLGLVLGADPDSRAIVDAARQLAIRAVGEILDLDPERPAVRLALRSWFATVNEAAVAWLQDDCPFPADDVVELLTATLAELLRQTARLDPTLDCALVLTALDQSDGITA